MAESTDRPEFPDPNHPLRTPDEDAQQQVVARIAQARSGKRARRAKEPEPAGTYRVTIGHLPMGRHPYIGRDALARAFGCGRTKADELAKHPERLDPWQVRQLCDLCGVTLEWLRGWDEVNAFGRYESAEDVAAMYSRLPYEDRKMVSGLLTRLLGADAVREVKHERWKRDNREWLERHPEEARRIAEIHRRTVRLLDSAGATRFAESVRGMATADEWELVEQATDELKGRGVDADEMTFGELLAYARGDSVED